MMLSMYSVLDKLRLQGLNDIVLGTIEIYKGLASNVSHDVGLS